MITINMTHVSLTIGTLHAPASVLSDLDIDLTLDDCEIEIGELALSESISSHETEQSDPEDPCYDDIDTLEEDPRSVAQATADGVGERLIYPH
jgi:hypothetical protein